jgi:hypothetical protein
MRASRLIRLGSVGALLVGLALTSTGVAVSSRSEPVAAGGDPYVVHPDRLRAELGQTGLDISYSGQNGKDMPAVIGTASQGDVEVGFEFRVYPTSNSATISGLGRLQPRIFGWNPSPLYSMRIRGVLANVAYAQYELVSLGAERSVAVYLARSAAHRHVQRSLDNALLRVFPKDDPYVHALESTPRLR